MACCNPLVGLAATPSLQTGLEKEAEAQLSVYGRLVGTLEMSQEQ